MLDKIEKLSNTRKFWISVGMFLTAIAVVAVYYLFITDTKVGAWYNPCQYQWCYPSVSPSETPSVTPEPTVEPSVSPTETPSVTPTEVPGNPDVSDNRSDGRSDGLCSKPPCVDNRSGQPLLPPSNSGK